MTSFKASLLDSALQYTPYLTWVMDSVTKLIIEKGLDPAQLPSGEVTFDRVKSDNF